MKEADDDRATAAVSSPDVLVVDDTPANLDLLSSLLQAHGYRVRVATGGARALIAARNSPPDLLLLDVRLPDLDGYEVCRRLKADPATQPVPVVFISAQDDVLDKVRAFDVGGADYVTKPFHPAEVLARVRHQLALRSLQREMERKGRELERRHQELLEWRQRLLQSDERAALIFSALSEALPGRVLDGRYRLEERIGSGGFGVVYRAVHVGLDRPVAVKVFQPSAANTTLQGNLERFRREGISACRVAHPHAVAVLDTGVTAGGIPYLVMELLSGPTLAVELRREGRLDPARCGAIALPLLEVLAAAHDAGIIHRDVKPENIVLHRDPQGGPETVKVVDFGLAKLLAVDDPEPDDGASRGLAVGSFDYMAPERLRHEPYDGRSDVYSVGVLLYRMLAGRLPFAQEGGSVLSIAVRHLRDEPEPLAQACPEAGVPAPLEVVVMEAMAKDPRHRPQARALAERLKAALGALCLALLGAVPVEALDPRKAPTQYVHDAWQTEQGLPQNTVNAVAQTRDGYLWLGTAEGLVRFDGVRFTPFDRRNTPALPNNVVSALRVDREGGLWIGTDGGLARWKDGRFLPPGTEGGAAGRRITALREDRHGRLWVGTAEHGLIRRDPGRDTTLTTRDGLSSNRVRDLAEGPDGSMWVATEGGGLTRFGPDGVQTVGPAQGLPSDRVRSLLVDRSGALWVGTYDAGVAVRREGRFQALPGLRGADVAALHQDRDGNVWIGTVGAGLARARGAELARFTTRDGLTNDKVWSLAEDAEGSLWIGCLAGGLNRLRDARLTPLGIPEGLGNDQVRAVAEDRRGAVWIGTEGGGLSQVKGGRVTLTLTRRDGLASDRVYALAEDPDGALWIGGVGRGLNRWSEGRLSSYLPADPRVMNGVHTLLHDGRGTLWIGTLRDGLYRLRPRPGPPGAAVTGELTPFTSAQGLGNDSVLALLQDRAGTVWVGTRGGGLGRIQDGAISALTTHDGFPSDFVYALHEDPDGVLWVGTFGGGLVRMEGGRRFVFTTEHGLFDDVIYGMVEDRSGHLWLTCNRGIFRVSRAELNEVAAGRRAAVVSTAYGLPDGMRSVECNSGGVPAARARDGTLWFATVRGAVAVDPARLAANPVPPPVHVEELRLDGRPQPLSERLDVPPGRRQLEFRYTALSLRTPSRVRFRYRLEGLEREWTEAGERRVAHYSRVPPGAYTFRVLAANEDGVWNEQGARLALSLAPRFHETLWFYALLAALGGLGVVGGHRFRVRQLRARQEELMELVQARTAALRASEARALDAREEALRASQAKSAFLARMSHELRTPLNAILGFVHLMRQEPGRSPPDRERLDIVSRSGEHLLRLINDVLSLARIESGRLSLDESAFDPGALLREMEALFRVSAERKGLRLRLEAAPGLPRLVRGDQGKLRQVLLNLLGNALKFTGSGQVVLRGRWEQGRAVLEVEDSGPGIPAAERAQLFEAFAQAEAGRRAGEGTGLGLAISLSFLRLMGGTLELEDPPGGGALFRIELPLPAAEASEAPDPDVVERPMVLAPDQPRCRVLVVDDSPENRVVLGGLLAAMGLEVEEAADGRSGLERWSAWRPDLVFMDMRMPGLDGHQATREIRHQEARHGWPRTPVLALTASALDLDREALLAAGCDDVLIKPFRPGSLWRSVALHLGVRFEERPSADPPLPPPAPPPPASLAHLPEAWRLDLHRVVERGDVQAALALVEGMAPGEAATAESLRALLKAYRLEEVLALTGPA